MTELQSKILEGLGSTTQSGVKDLSEAQFVKTEIDAIERSLKPHLYSTIFFTLAFSFQLFASLIERPEEISLIRITFSFLGWAACLYFFQSWIKKKKRLALLELLKSCYSDEIDLDNWLSKNKKPFSGIFSTLFISKSKSLNEIERLRQSKYMFFITQAAMLIAFTAMAFDGNSIMAYASPVFMLLTPLVFIDWKVHSYFYSLQVFSNYERGELSVSQ
ncbi:MAG: hypothetical protein HWE07_13045 [Cytophagia bacterium]|nr:hypothetical protein [Cytophagia bacterium]